jgi:hypothetical protein
VDSGACLRYKALVSLTAIIFASLFALLLFIIAARLEAIAKELSWRRRRMEQLEAERDLDDPELDRKAQFARDIVGNHTHWSERPIEQ